MSDRVTQCLIYVSLILMTLIFSSVVFRMGNVDMPFADRNANHKDACTVKIITIEGDLVTYALGANWYTDEHGVIQDKIIDSASIVSAIESANASTSVCGIMLQIDSTGGSPVAAEEIERALLRSEKPSVALIRGAGLSAAYWAGSGADYIISASNSEVGSIGVTASYLDQSGRNKEEGYTFHALSTGEYKDMLDPNKPLTEKEKELVLNDLRIMFDNFTETVSRNRGLSLDIVQDELATGASFVGPVALEKGLIDALGDKETAREIFAQFYGKTPQDIVFCSQ